ncbi:MAG: ABC transporter permease subunit, partial [Acetivibrionales bacterium]
MKNNKLFSKLNLSNITVVAAVVIFVIFYVAGSLLYKGFFSAQVFVNLLIDNAHLFIVSYGATLVLLTGGIDLSIGAVFAFGSMVSAFLLQKGMQIPVVFGIVLLTSVVFGALNGYLITYRSFPPFIATLASQYLARGACYILSPDTIAVSDKALIKISLTKIRLFGQKGPFITYGVIVAFVLFVVFHILTKHTKFGRSVYALGGNEQSASLMGLPTKRIKFSVYTICGLTSGISSVVFTIYMLSAFPLFGETLHLDAVSSAVIGGTLTTGGVGVMSGTVFGVLTTGVIQTLITFQGTLSSWWTRIITALLLLVFIMLQRYVVYRRERTRVSKEVE